MKRTTAGISYFRVQGIDSEYPNTRSAKSILKEITEDNVKLREGEKIQEKSFDIKLSKDLISMRPDTKIVFVDIPGINEANTDNKYKDYVAEKWDTFDCVIVVMDGKQGVNTEDQVFLLNLVKENLTKKHVPVIILCNKVDDPDDEEQTELVNEARKEVEKVFGVNCRSKALKSILEQKNGQPLSEACPGPYVAAR